MDFETFFAAATGGHECYDYQRLLALGDGDTFDRSLLIDVPTGMGKTAAVVLAWLWNRVAHPDSEHRRRWPRRFVYCLPMRTLVQQTQEQIAQWLANLAQRIAGPEIEWLSQRSPVVLMGGGSKDSDEADWDAWPEKPCILVGTQDMLLSRAMNRGYAMSRFRWPLHFGLLNNDCLWVMDEVQLMGPGLWTSGQLDWMRQERFRPAARCFTWWMSATHSGGFLETKDREGVKPPDTLPFDPQRMPDVIQCAQRPCVFWKAPAVPLRRPRRNGSAATATTADFFDQLASAVTGGHQPGTLTLMVCNTVAAAQEIHRRIVALGCGEAGPILLTSRFRGMDRKANEGRLIAFEAARKDGTAASGPGLICVATQVVEAGIDVSACRLWSELAPWASMVQRMGRLNRDGKCNDQAQALLFEIPPAKAMGAKQLERVGPYLPAELTRGRRLADGLARLYSREPRLPAVDALTRLGAEMSAEVKAALQPAPAPFPRAMDLHGLFSTEPDIFGGFTDVSPFIRDSDPNTDVILFWRNFDPAKLPSGHEMDGPVYQAAEGCGVPIDQARAFLNKNSGFVWNDEADRWEKRRGTEIFPGMVVMLGQRAGGYNPTQGWTAAGADRIAQLPPPGPFDDGFGGDVNSESEYWVRLNDHLGDVRREAEEIARCLGLPRSLRESLVTAAACHDIGKALPQWQGGLPRPAPEGDTLWAKAPFLFTVQLKSDQLPLEQIEAALYAAGIQFRRGTAGEEPRLASYSVWHTKRTVRDRPGRAVLTQIRDLAQVERARMVPFRPGLRHEAASALALWHRYFRRAASFPALAIYLAAAHHGKVRTVLTARPDRGNTKGDNACGVPTDIGLIPWEGGEPLEFVCATDGAAGSFSPDGTEFIADSPGWTALIADLLGGWQARVERPPLLAIRDPSEPHHLGPFALAYCEALLVCADVRGSRSPSHVIPL